MWSRSLVGPSGPDGAYTLYADPGTYDLWAQPTAAGANATATRLVSATQPSASLANQDLQVSSAAQTVTGTVQVRAGTITDIAYRSADSSQTSVDFAYSDVGTAPAITAPPTA